MRSKAEILAEKTGEVINSSINEADVFLIRVDTIFEAMDTYASEVLREELIKYTIWHQDKMFGCHALEEAIEHGVDEYLKTK